LVTSIQIHGDGEEIMKNRHITGFFAIMIVGFLLISGCTSTGSSGAAPVVTPAIITNSATPDITGIWSGTAVGHTRTEGFVEYPTTLYNISMQKGQAFTGAKEYPRMDGKTHYENFSGVITRSGDIYIADHELGGIIIGKLTGSGTMDLHYIEDGADAKAFIIQMTRQKS
jgi:hypothetical protein